MKSSFSRVVLPSVSAFEELGCGIAKFIFDDCGDMTLESSEKKEREERFQNYIKAGSGKVSEKEAKEKVSGLVSGDWEIFESSSKALTEGREGLSNGQSDLSCYGLCVWIIPDRISLR